MWPLSGAEIRAALGVRERHHADDELFTGVAVGGRTPGPTEALLALTLNGRDGHVDVEPYLRAQGRLALVSARWAHARSHGARCVVVEDPFVAFKRLSSALRVRFPFPVVAIAGANGKTTTKEMTRAVLSGGGWQVTATGGTENGHYGVPLTLLDRAHSLERPPQALVLEIGIDAIGAMREHVGISRPDVAVLTSLGAEHLRGLVDAETASREEIELFEAAPYARRVFDAGEPRFAGYVANARAGDVIVVDECDLAAIARVQQRNNGALGILWYTVGSFDGDTRTIAFRFEPNGLQESGRRSEGAATKHELRVPMPGEPHARLAALAAGVAFALGRSGREILDGWSRFRPPESRAAVVTLARDLVLVDDTFNASPGSMKAALALSREPCWAARPKAFILGDMLDLGDATREAHEAVGLALCDMAGAHVRLFGDGMSAAYENLARGAKWNGPWQRAETGRPELEPRGG